MNNPVNLVDAVGIWPEFLEKLGARLQHTLKIIGRILVSPIKAISAEIGAGVGIGAKASVTIKNIPVEIGIVTSITDSVSYEKGKFDARNTTSTNIGFNIADHIDFSHTNGREHSYYDENCTCDFMSSTFGEKSKCVANQRVASNDATIGLSIGAYLLFGAEISIGIDLVAWNEELISIFYENQSYEE